MTDHKEREDRKKCKMSNPTCIEEEKKFLIKILVKHAMLRLICAILNIQ